MILSDGVMIVLSLLLHFSNGELTLVRKQDDVYCISNSSNEALTWIPTIEKNKQFTYKEEVNMIPANENLEEFRDLNCDLMRDGGCPLADKFRGPWEIMDNASDGYGFITDHRWHSLPIFETTGQPTQMLQIPITPSEKGHIYMSILAKNNASLTVTDGVKGFQIRIDAYFKTRTRQSLSYCTHTQFPPHCYGADIISAYGTVLNDGKQWKNVKVKIEPKESVVLIKIDDDGWAVPYTSYIGRDYRIGQLKYVFINTENQQMGFWKFHQYRALRTIQRGTAISVDFTTRSNPQLCLSILYHSGGDGYNQTAAKLTIHDVSASNSEAFEENLQAGGNWQEYRHVFQLNINTHYQLILTPDRIYPLFAIGEIRVCREKEIIVSKIKSEERDITCSPLNENTKIIERRSDTNTENQFSYQCLNGSYGENCDIPCSDLGTKSCKGLRVCSATACSCLPGYNGSACENECPGRYGVNCRFNCHRCRHGMQCDFVNGACPDADCEDGYSPGPYALCFDECRQGTYGYNCKQKCSAYCLTANRCNHINGSCTRDRCNPADYEPPTCQYPQLVIIYPPEKIMSGVNEIQLRIRMNSIPKESIQSIGHVGIQYRLHQTGAEWQEGPKFAYSEVPNIIMLSSLTPKTTYDVRAILYDHMGNGNTGDRVPILPSVTTLCRPAGKVGLEATPEKNIIKVKINSQMNSEDCVAADYQVTVRGTYINYRIELNDDLTGESVGLDYNSVYDVTFAASDKIIESITIVINSETQLVISYPPEKIMSGVNDIQLRLRMESIPKESRQSIGHVGIQYRLHQTGAEWQEGPKFAYSEVPNLIMLSSLTPKTTYDVRAILYDHMGNGNTRDRVPILPSVTTLCRPAGKDELEAVPEKNIIKVKINTMANNENCVSTDYKISIHDTDQLIVLNENLTGHSGKLEFSKQYTVEIAVLDFLQLVNITTESELEMNVTSDNNNSPTDMNYIYLYSTAVLVFICLTFIVYIIIKKLKRNTDTPAAVVEAVAEAVVEAVEYAEVDLTKAVALPDPELPPRAPEVAGYLRVLEPYNYDVVRAPQPLQHWIKHPRFGRRNIAAPRNVEPDG